MQSKASCASRYRVPAAARCAVLRSPIPSRLSLGASTERWSKPHRAVEKSEASSVAVETDEAVSREVTQTSPLKDRGSLVSHDKKADGLDPDLKVHEHRSGVVQSVEKHGVLVDIGAGSIGLLHKNQISHERVNPEDLEKMFSVGDEIKVMVRQIDKDQSIYLSTKSLEVNPGDMVKNPQLVYEKAEEVAAAFRANVVASWQAKEKAKEVDPDLKVGEVRSGVVKSIKDFGCLVNIGGGSVGLLPKNQISHNRVMREDIDKMFVVGAEIKVMVREVDTKRQRISLSTKDLEVNPGDMLKNPQLVYEKAEEAAATSRAKVVMDSNLKVHDLKSGVVKFVKPYGVFVDIGSGSVGMLHISQVSSVRLCDEDIEKMFSVGDEIKAMVHQIDTDRQRFSLTTKPLEVNPGDMLKDPQLVYEKAEESAAAYRAKLEAVVDGLMEK